MSSSTFTLLTQEEKAYAHKKAKPDASPIIFFKFNGENEGDNTLKQKLLRLKKNKLQQLSLEEGFISCLDIENEFLALNHLSKEDDLTDEEKITLEEYKAALMTAVRNHLYKIDITPKKTTPAKFTPKSILKWCVFCLLMFFEFSPMVFGGIIYAKMSLEALIPFIPFVIPSAVLTGIGIACVFNMLIGNICFVAPILMERLGILFSKKQKSSLSEAFRLQHEATEKINNKLLSYNNYSSEDYHSYSKLAKLFNHHIDEVKNNYPEYKENIYSKIANVIMGSLILINTASGALYLSANLVAFCLGVALEGSAAAITVTAFIASMPLVIGLIAIAFIIPNLAINYYLRMQSASRILDYDAILHENVKNNLNTFEIKHTEFDHVHSKKLASEMTAEIHDDAIRNKKIVKKTLPTALIDEIKKLRSKEIEMKTDAGKFKSTSNPFFNKHPKLKYSIDIEKMNTHEKLNRQRDLNKRT